MVILTKPLWALNVFYLFLSHLSFCGSKQVAIINIYETVNNFCNLHFHYYILRTATFLDSQRKPIEFTPSIHNVHHSGIQLQSTCDLSHGTLFGHLRTINKHVRSALFLEICH